MGRHRRGNALSTIDAERALNALSWQRERCGNTCGALNENALSHGREPAVGAFHATIAGQRKTPRREPRGVKGRSTSKNRQGWLAPGESCNEQNTRF